MKKVYKLLGIIAFVVIIGFSFTVCSNGSIDPGQIDPGQIDPGHTHTPGAVATCTTDQTCTVCGAVIVSALGHSWADTVNNRLCLTCGELNFTPDVTIDLVTSEVSGAVNTATAPDITISPAAGETVLITGDSGVTLRSIRIDAVTDIYLHSSVRLKGRSTTALRVQAGSTMYGGGPNVSITGTEGLVNNNAITIDSSGGSSTATTTFAGSFGTISGGNHNSHSGGRGIAVNRGSLDITASITAIRGGNSGYDQANSTWSRDGGDAIYMGNSGSSLTISGTIGLIKGGDGGSAAAGSNRDGANGGRGIYNSTGGTVTVTIHGASGGTAPSWIQGGAPGNGDGIGADGEPGIPIDATGWH